MEFLKRIKPGMRPDGSPLPMQEFLDRQSVWELEVRCKVVNGFVAISVKVNGLIIWLNDIGV